MFTFGSAFVLFVSECIGMQKMWEEQEVFPGMQGSQLRLCSLQTPFSTPLQLRYSTPASTGRRFVFISASLASKVASLSR